MFGKNPFSEFRATQQQVQENKFLIPEEIPATERTAFHGAAAAAHKAGKTSFSFAGKKFPIGSGCKSNLNRIRCAFFHVKGQRKSSIGFVFGL